ncbi:MAG: isoaspartyl peptidase/L-asparaginase, partial [Bacteroidia bacterium]|nr:isoaspartyl peptidase/L-asparaginase [Bacteroidia bacterium]
GLPIEDETYFYDEFRYQQWQEALRSDSIRLDHSEDNKFGTVGAVARDVYGNLAAATSTGGMTNKRWGRIGDSPVIGAGTFAMNQTCAVSCTGHGEYFLRYLAAYDVSCLMEYAGKSLAEACQIVIHEKLKPVGGEGGLIAVAKQGIPVLCFNSEGMYRGFCTDIEMKISIYEE